MATNTLKIEKSCYGCTHNIFTSPQEDARCPKTHFCRRKKQDCDVKSEKKVKLRQIADVAVVRTKKSRLRQTEWSVFPLWD